MSNATPEFAKELLSFIPNRPDYNLWLRVISAIGNTFPEQTALEILNSHFKDEGFNETAIKVTQRLKDINFGSLVHFAKEYGYNFNKTDRNRFYGVFPVKAISKHVQKETQFVRFNNDVELCYRFQDYNLEERAAIFEYEGGFSRLQAEKIILNENPNAERERVYRIGINKDVLNKNLNPKTKQPYSFFSNKNNSWVTNYKPLTENFKNHYCTLFEIAMNIGKGSAILCGHLKTDENSNTYRTKENFLYSDCFGIDIDNADSNKQQLTEGYLSIENCLNLNETRKALMIYTTPNHTDHWNRFRIIIPFPRLIKNPEHFTKFVTHYIGIYKSDEQCKEPVRAFYGNDNATVYLIPSGEILEFKEGVLQ